MKWLPIALPVAAALVLGACHDADPLGPEVPSLEDVASLDDAALSARAGPASLDVMTWNIYVGADLTQLLAVPLPQIACGVATLYGNVLATDFGARAVAIADQIEAHRPHIVGLNEVSTFDFTYGFFHPDLVFLDVLLDELESRGLGYDAPAQARSSNFQVAMPISYAGDCEPQDLLTYTEYDVLLVRDDVEVTSAAHGNFAMPLPLPAPLPAKYSGWAYVDIEHKALPYRVFTTHLEPADVGPCTTDSGMEYIHDQQAAELMGLLDASPHPTVLTGDLNSDASGCTTDTYPDLIEAGFVDAWLIGPARGNGFTANQDDDLLNEVSALFHRIDFILYRDAVTTETGRFQGSVHAELVGEEPDDRILTAFDDLVWPSDHAGVVAELRIAPGLGLVE